MVLEESEVPAATTNSKHSHIPSQINIKTYTKDLFTLVPTTW